jgi:ribosomal protein S18 acetylase RimI-like enzyme
MVEIKIPGVKDALLISQLAARTFYESHGTSASEKDLKEYEQKRLNPELFKAELCGRQNEFRVAYYNNIPVGFSKIVYDSPNPKISETPVCELNKIYVLKDHYDKKIGKSLFDLNVELAKQHGQKGMWLYVWTENTRALSFYEKQGFKIIADAQFKVSETHSNPNYWMYLKF